MKKLIALVLAAVMMLSCAAFAEEATKISTADGSFAVTFQLPEGAELLSGEWATENCYMGNLRMEDGLFVYMSIYAPENAGETGEDTVAVTYNEENGYTDAFLTSMMEEKFSSESDNYETGVKTTAYGTKLAIIRFNDEFAPYAYVMTVWHDYEIGLNIFSVAEDQTYLPVSDEQLNKVVDFVSELWMLEKTDAE